MSTTEPATTGATTADLTVDPGVLRASVREKYAAVATRPDGTFHFHTGRPLARLLGYPDHLVDPLPDRAVESFAGVADPFSLRPIGEGDRVVDLGSGGGFDCFVAATLVGPSGHVIGVDMTPQMLAKARATADQLDLEHVEFREGIIESLDGWVGLLEGAGFVDVQVGEPVDTFGGAPGEPNARRFEVFGHAFAARKPDDEAAALDRGVEIPFDG